MHEGYRPSAVRVIGGGGSISNKTGSYSPEAYVKDYKLTENSGFPNRQGTILTEAKSHTLGIHRQVGRTSQKRVRFEDISFWIF